MEPLNEILQLLNPWWKDSHISSELARPYQRKIFRRIFSLLSQRQIVILSGLRRVGKTTLLYQLIEKHLKMVDSQKILYFNLDKEVKELTEVLKAYGELTGIDWKKEKLLFFVDELAKLEHWGRKIKLLYDAFPHIKFIVSSSSSIGLEEEALKNLGGRYFLINVKPLSFTEFLELKGKSRYLSNQNLWQEEIKKEFNSYLLRSFPEIIAWPEQLLIKDYLRTTIIDKIVKQDLPEKFKNVSRDLLSSLLEIFYSEPGIYLDYDSLSQKLRISKKTLVQHLFFLEFSYLLRRIRNFRVNILSASKKMQRVYPYWWTLAYCYSENKDKILENLVASHLDAKYYWRKQGKEIDFLIVSGKKIIPLEVKNKEEIGRNELKNLKYFLQKYKLGQGIIVYQGEEKELKINKDQKIKLIPFWKFLLAEEK